MEKVLNKKFFDNILEVSAAGQDGIVQLVLKNGLVKNFDLKLMQETDREYKKDPIIWQMLETAAGATAGRSRMNFEDKVEFLGDDALLHIKATDFNHPVDFKGTYNVSNATHIPVGRKDGTRVSHPALYAIAFSAYIEGAANGIKMFDSELLIDKDCASDLVSAYKTFNSLVLGHDLEDSQEFARIFKNKADGETQRVLSKQKEESQVDNILSSLK